MGLLQYAGNRPSGARQIVRYAFKNGSQFSFGHNLLIPTSARGNLSRAQRFCVGTSCALHSPTDLEVATMSQRDFQQPAARPPVRDRETAEGSQNRVIIYIVVALVVLGVIFFASRAYWGGPAATPPPGATTGQPAEPNAMAPAAPNAMAPAAPNAMAPSPAAPAAETPAPAAPATESPAPAAPAQPAPAQ